MASVLQLGGFFFAAGRGRDLAQMFRIKALMQTAMANQSAERDDDHEVAV